MATTKVASLQEKIVTLQSLHNSITALRSVPPLLLRPPTALAGLPEPPCYTPDIQQFNGISDTIKSEAVQRAFIAALDSEKASNTNAATLIIQGRRESRKRRRPPTPDPSPHPYKNASAPSQKKSSSLFPCIHASEPPVNSSKLTDFVHNFNSKHGPNMDLKLWRRNKGTPLTDPFNEEIIVLRLIIKDVLTVYITLTSDIADHERSQLVTESVSGFAPREKKSPHTQSDYTVYCAFTQHISKMLQSEPMVSLQQLIGLLESYNGLFIDRCTSCERVLSAEGHVPPVARTWVPEAESRAERIDGAAVPRARGRWEPRHVGCR